MIKKKDIENIDPLVDVDLVPLERSDQGSPVARRAVVLDPHGINIEVGFVSPDYRLVTNRVARDVALDVITRTGFDFEERQRAFSGKVYRQRWTFPQVSIEPRKGDFVQLGIDVINSYDGSTPFGLSFVAMRLVCLNGMVMDFALGGFRFRHFGANGDWDRELEEAIENISRMADNTQKILPALTRMTQERIGLADLQHIVADLEPGAGILTAKALTVFEGETAWDIYNGYTKVLSDENTIRADRRNREISRYFFNRYCPKTGG